MRNYKNKLLNLQEISVILDCLGLNESNSKSLDLPSDLFKLLKGDENNGISKQAFETVLRAILMPQRSTSAGAMRNSPRDQEFDFIGKFDNTEKGQLFILNENEKQFLRKKFAIRVSCNRLSRSPSHERRASPKNEKRSPKILPRSSQMANVARSKALLKMGDSKENPLAGVPVSDLLNFHKVLYERYFYMALNYVK